MKAIWKSSLSLIILSVLLLGCANQAGQQPVVEEKPILIGSVLNTTGVQAFLDQVGLLGAQLAVDELNKQGGILGRKVELVNIDGQSDFEVTERAAEELVSKGAVALLAPCDFDFGSPVSKVAQRAGIVGISICASSALYNSTVLGDKQFTLSMWTPAMSAAAAEYAYKDRGWRTAYVITDDTLAYTVELSEYFIQHFENLGGTILGEDHFSEGSSDFSAQATRLQALDKQPDVVYLSAYVPADTAAIIKTIRDADLNLPFMGGDIYDDPSLPKALGTTYGNEVIYVTHTWIGANSTQDMARFIQLYTKKYGAPPESPFVTTGWDVIMVLAQGIEVAKTTEGAAVAKAIENREFTLLTGKLTWTSADKGHEPQKEAAVVLIQNGKPTFVGWLKPENPPAP